MTTLGIKCEQDFKNNRRSAYVKPESRCKEEKNDQIAIGSAFWESDVLPGLQVVYMKYEDAVDAVVPPPFKELAHVAEYPYSVDHSIH